MPLPRILVALDNPPNRGARGRSGRFADDQAAVDDLADELVPMRRVTVPLVLQVWVFSG